MEKSDTEKLREFVKTSKSIWHKLKPFEQQFLANYVQMRRKRKKKKLVSYRIRKAVKAYCRTDNVDR